MLAPDLGQQVEAVAVGEPDVEDGEVVEAALELAPGLLDAAGERGPVALVGEDLGQGRADARLVIDDEYVLHEGRQARRLRRRESSAGSGVVNTIPKPAAARW
jgi:hypothetical protein